MILDELMPTYDVVERHQTVVRAAPEQVFAAIGEADLGGGLVTRTLLCPASPGPPAPVASASCSLSRGGAGCYRPSPGISSRWGSGSSSTSENRVRTRKVSPQMAVSWKRMAG